MAQTGYTPIQLYRSATASAAPTAGNLADGELAINTADGKLFYKDSGGSVQVLATKAGAAGDVVGPASATDGGLVAFDGTSGKLVKAAATVTVAQGGTGQTTAQAAINSLAGAVTSGQYLRGNGTNVVMSAIQAADVPTLNQNTTGTASNVTGTVAIANGGTGATTAANARTNLGGTTVGQSYFTLTNPSAITFPRMNADNTVSALSAADFRTAIGAGTGTGTVTSVAVSGGTTGLTTSGGPITGSGTITLAGTLGVANGGTGATTLTANNVLLGNGTSALQTVAPGTSGNVLTSNGTTWTSAAPAATLTGQTNSASPYETSLGVNAGANNTGLYNVFIGYDAGAANTSATQNVAIGYQAMDANTTGAKNIAIGRDALGAANGASENVAIGVGSGFAVTTGTQNVIIGQQSAAGGSNNLTSGANNILIGYQAAASSATVSNETTIGNSSTTAFRLFGDLQLQRDYTEKVVTANTGTAYTIDLANGTLQILTLTGNCTFTFPTATAGKSFMLFLKQDATGSRTVTWPSSTNPVKWPGGTAPTITATANKMDKFVFTADGTNWIGSNAGQNYL